MLFGKGLIEKRGFSLLLGRNDQEASITLGDSNEDYLREDFTYGEVDLAETETDEWAFNVTTLSLGSTRIGNGTAYLSTSE